MGPILLLVAIALGYAWWSSARTAAERAEDVGRNACHAAGVQWLDQTVHADGLRLRRRRDGRLGLERSFRFEYSEDGQERHVGRLVLMGDELVSFTGPARSTQVADPASGDQVALSTGRISTSRTFMQSGMMPAWFTLSGM